jgi:ABC-type amino acid transport substrate-binding protein
MKNYPETTVIKGSLALAKNSMCIRQGDQIFLNWLNLFIADMKETGTLDRIFQKYGAKREIFF